LAVAHVRVDRDQLEQLLGRHPTSVPYPPHLSGRCSDVR
jgi:hypothetical protein